MSEEHDRTVPVEIVDLLPAASAGEIGAFQAEQLVERELRAEPGPYPYVVTRHFPAVYSSKRVSWRPPGAPGDALIRCSEPFDGEGRLLDEARALVVAYALQRAAATGFKHCAVFGERDAVYVGPDGNTTASTDLPRWGRSITRHGGRA